MATRVGAVGAVAVSVATALGALVVLTSGQLPAPGAAARPWVADPPAPSLPGSSVPEHVPAVPGSSVPGSSVPGSSVPGSSVPGSSVPGSSVPVAAEVNVAVSGPGATVRFSGVCPVVDGVVPGPVQVWVTRIGADGADVVVVTVTSAQSWVYEWTAPTDPALFGSYRFVFWCGDPSGTSEPYPDELAVTIDMVATAPPPTLPTTSTTVPVVAQDPPVPAVTPVPPVVVLPETS